MTVSVTDFGATGNGTTDDTAAIQAAINSFAGPGELYFPTGTYLISSALVLPYNNPFFRIFGEGWGSRIKARSGASFDLLTWAPPSVTYAYHQVDNLAFDSSSNTGIGNCIDTAGMSNIRMTNLYLTGIAINGSGIFTNGKSSTYNHDVFISDIYIDTSTGGYGINVGALASDTQINNVVIQGRNTLGYGLYYNPGAAHILTTRCHPYNCASAVCSVNSPSDSLWFSDCIFDGGGGVVTYNFHANGMQACTFDNCKFTYATSGTDCIALINSFNNQFNNCTIEASTGIRWGVNESGTSNNNSFTQCIFVGTFSSGKITLVGADTIVRFNGAEHHVSGGYGMAANTTVYVGAGGASTSSENTVAYIAPYAGLIRKLTLGVTSLPGAGQSVSAIVRHNGTSTGIIATVSGSNYVGTATGVVFCNEADTIDVQITSTSGAAYTIARVTAVVAY